MHFQNRQTRLSLSVFAFGAVVRSPTDFIVLTADFAKMLKCLIRQCIIELSLNLIDWGV